jgi:hypothetical protein
MHPVDIINNNATRSILMGTLLEVGECIRIHRAGRLRHEIAYLSVQVSRTREGFPTRCPPTVYSGCVPRVIVACLGLAMACRSPEQEFPCTDSSQCTLGTIQGECEVSGFCSFPSDTCPSGQRYGDGASLDLRNQCVDPGLAGLMAWFKLDDTDGTIFADSAGGPSGTCTPPACPVLGPGHSGNAYQFDGVDDCVRIPDSPALAPARSFTLSLWFRADAVADATQVGKRVDVAGAPYDSWELQMSTGKVEYFTSNHGATPNDSIGSPMVGVFLGQWEHVAATWDGSTARLYVNGAEVISGNTPPIVYDHHDAFVGCDDNAPLSQYFTGAMQDFRLYGRALASTEIQSLASQ